MVGHSIKPACRQVPGLRQALNGYLQLMTGAKIFKNTIIGLLIVAVLGFIISESTCRSRTDRWYMPASSENRQTSITEDYYIKSYFPIRESFAIPYSTDTLRLDSAWSEHSWTTKTTFGLCVCERKTKGDGYNFCMPFTTNNSDVSTYPFELIQLKKANDQFYDPGSYSRGRFNFESGKLEDTVKIIISSKPGDPLTTNAFSDTLIYVRTNTNK